MSDEKHYSSLSKEQRQAIWDEVSNNFLEYSGHTMQSVAELLSEKMGFNVTAGNVKVFSFPFNIKGFAWGRKKYTRGATPESTISPSPEASRDESASREDLVPLLKCLEQIQRNTAVTTTVAHRLDGLLTSNTELSRNVGYLVTAQAESLKVLREIRDAMNRAWFPQEYQAKHQGQQAEGSH